MSSSIAKFRWLEDITINFTNERPYAELKLIIIADIKREYIIKKGSGKVVRRDSNEAIPCQKAKCVTIELLSVKSMSKNKRILLLTLPSGDELIQSDGSKVATVSLKFSYTRGGEMRELVENSRRITNDQHAVLDKLKRVCNFFESLRGICDSVKEVHRFVEAAFSAVLFLYNLCEKQKKCRDAARGLVDEMDDLLNCGVERLSDILKENSNTRMAFSSLSDVIVETSEFIRSEENKGTFRTLIRDAVSPVYEKGLEELRYKLKRTMRSLKGCVTFNTWEITIDDVLERRLKSVSTAHYQSGACCLPNTRLRLLDIVDAWIMEDTSENKMAWVYGCAGSRKSALFNSISENLEKAGIPFTCFSCKRDDTDRSDVQRVLPTLSYGLAQFLDDYRGMISNLVKQPAGRSISTGDVRKQSELLFGTSPSYDVLNPLGARRPPVYVILIDALDECWNAHERVALVKFLRDLANAVPWIKVIITSRPERDIVSVLQRTPKDIFCIDINDDKWDTDSDIRLFIQTKADELEINLRPDQINRLQEKAAGLFVWCTTAFRFIEESRESSLRIVENILGFHSPTSQENPHIPLYLLYQHVFNTAVSKERDRSLMEWILSVIFVAASRQPLSVVAITELLFPEAKPGDELEEKSVWVENIIRSLFAILYIEKESGIVRTCHPSVLDYIEQNLSGGIRAPNADTNKPLQVPFSINLEETHARVFSGCYELMIRRLKFNLCGLEDSSLLNQNVHDLSLRIAHNISEALQYSSFFWLSHLQEAGPKETAKRILSFLSSTKALFWIEVLSLLNAVERGILILQGCANFFTDRQEILEIACEWERFLLAYGDALQSTPHLYLSALSWLPQNSQLRKIIPIDTPIVANVASSWDAERWSDYVGSTVLSVTYSPDGRFFAAGCADGSVHHWESNSGKRIGKPLLSNSSVHSIRISQDGHLLACGHGNGAIRVWDLDENDAIPKVLKGHSKAVNSVAFSLDGRQIVSGSRDKAMIWDVEAGERICNPLGTLTGSFESVVLFANDRVIVTRSSDSSDSLLIWDSGTGEQLGESSGCNLAHSISCSADGRFIAFNDEKDITLLDTKTCSPIGKLSSPSNLICFSADGRYVASGLKDKNHSICVWSAKTCQLVCELRGHTKAVSSLAFSPNGRRLLSGSKDGTIRVWDLDEVMLSEKLSESQSMSILCVAYSSDGNLIASGSDDGTVRVWDAHTGRGVGEPLQGHVGWVKAVAFSGDCQWFVSGSRDMSLRIWDISKGGARGEPMLGHTNWVRCVAVSPDSQYIASGSGDMTVRLWEVGSRATVMVFEGHTSPVNSVAFLAGGERIVSGSSDASVRIWNIRTGVAEGEPLRGHNDPVNAIAVSADGQSFASGSWENIAIWSAQTHAILVPGDSAGPGYILSAAFSHEGKYLISGSYFGTIKIRKAQTGEVVGSALKGHTGNVNSVAFSPNCREIVSGSRDGTIRVWDIRTRTDLELYNDKRKDYSEFSEEDLRVRWNVFCTRMNNGGWIYDEKPLLWVPLQHRRDIINGLRLVIGAGGEDIVRPRVDYHALFKYSGRCWVDLFQLLAKV